MKKYKKYRYKCIQKYKYEYVPKSVSDIPDQSANDLVEEITALQEATFDYNYYTGASKGPSPYDASHWIGPEGYLCPSQVDYVKIKR